MLPRQLVRLATPRATTRKWSTPRCQLRYQSASTSGTSGKASGGSNFASGVAGGLAGAALAYGIYCLTPAGRAASKLNKAVAEANSKFQATSEKLQNNSPSPDQAVEYIKQIAHSYVVWIPGGRAYVDTAFQDWDAIRDKHRQEADDIINTACKQFQEISKAGLSVETAYKAYDVVAEMSKKMADLSGDAISDILDNHPQVKAKFGGSIEQLRDMGNNYGPEAKKQVDEAWSQLKEVLAGGLTAANVERARKLAQDKLQQVRKLGDEAWKKGLSEAKPYLDKNPRVRELIEKNADALKQGNLAELFNKVSSAVDSGDLGNLSKYVDAAVEKAKAKGSGAAGEWGLDSIFGMIPQGHDLLRKMEQIRQLADKNAEAGEKLLKDTAEELKKVLETQARKAQEIVEQAKRDSNR